MVNLFNQGKDHTYVFILSDNFFYKRLSIAGKTLTK